MTYPRKPEFWAPCNGCGLCCIAEACSLALIVDPKMKAPCGFLEWDDGRFWCGLVRHPTRHISGRPDAPEIDAKIGGLIRETLGSGECDAEGDEGKTAPEYLASEGL